ncbi:MAG: extracellular solute-binding protein [Clostridia bacterium]|nr:extracellular solute-binding protein [Clostridia bacterium]
MKKALSLFIAVLMLLALIPGAVAEEAPVTLTLFYQSTRPINEFTELTHQYIIDELGIDINLIQGGDNWKQQLALYMTSGDIPDLMAFMDAATFQGYAAEGAFYDITDRVYDYENIIAYLNSVVGYTADDMLARTTLDGAIYGIPSVTIARSYYSENIRTDWLEKLGLEVPTTLDEFTEVMRAFTKNDPDGNGVDDTYGFSGAQTYYSLTPFFGAFGARPDQAYFLSEDGEKVVTNVISDDYKAALAYIRDIYAEGLIDPEVFTATYQQTQEKVVRGEFGYWCGWWSAAGNVVSRFGYTESNPEDSLTVIDPPVGPDGRSGVIAQDPCESYMGIGYNTEHIDEVLKLIDWAMSTDGHRTVMWGVEGQFWTQDENGNIDWNYSVGGKDKLGNEVSDMQVYRFFYDIAVENSARALDDSFASKLYRKSIEIYSDIEVINDLFLGLTSDEYVSYYSDLDTYVKESGIKFITGESDLDADWDNYVSTYLSMGGEALRTSLLNAYNDLHGTSLSFK